MRREGVGFGTASPEPHWTLLSSDGYAPRFIFPQREKEPDEIGGRVKASNLDEVDVVKPFEKIFYVLLSTSIDRIMSGERYKNRPRAAPLQRLLLFQSSMILLPSFTSSTQFFKSPQLEEHLVYLSTECDFSLSSSAIPLVSCVGHWEIHKSMRVSCAVRHQSCQPPLYLRWSVKLKVAAAFDNAHSGHRKLRCLLEAHQKVCCSAVGSTKPDTKTSRRREEEAKYTVLSCGIRNRERSEVWKDWS